MNIKSRNKVTAEFSMSSMTDIVFLLLIFFMITSTLVHPNALKLLLPKSSGQVSGVKPLTTVSISDKGNNSYDYAVEYNRVNLENLEQALISKIGSEPNPTVALHVDKSVPMEQVVKIMNIAKNNNFRLILATEPD